MKHTIQMTATAGLTVPHSIRPIFQYIFDCLGKRSIRSINGIIEKAMHPQRVIFWCGFWYGGTIGPFFFKNEQGTAVRSMASVTVPCSTNFCSQKLKRKTWTTFGFNSRDHLPHSQRNNRSFARRFRKSNNQTKF